MATGCGLAGSSRLSSMSQLVVHPPTYTNVSTVLPHSSKASSLVLIVFLPSRLNPKCGHRQRMRLSPTMCGHGDLEIVSVKELADGFFHFSFGTPSNVGSSSKVDELSSSSSEHLAGKVPAPHRLPSKFSKKSPIPVAGMRRRKRQGRGPSRQGESAEAADAVSVKEAANSSSSRPKSCFLKRSPIPSRESVQPPLRRIGSEEASAAHHVGSEARMQKAEIASVKVGRSKRLPSTFVRRSPIPTRIARNNHVRSSDSVSDKVADGMVNCVGNATVGTSARPKSVFSRRSPIVRMAPHSLSSPAKTGKTLEQESHGSSAIADGASQQETAAACETASENRIDLHAFKLTELKNLAKTKGLKGYSKLKKGELLDLLQSLNS